MENQRSEERTERLPKRVRLGARIRADARFSFVIHFIVYVCINGFLALINLLASPGNWWVLWPMVGWGLGLVIHGAIALIVPGMQNLRRKMYEQELKR